jgi:hypothetical protein
MQKQVGQVGSKAQDICETCKLERQEIMGISKQIQLEEISADSFIRERADRLRNEYARKLQECVEDTAIEADIERQMENHNG